MERYRIKPKLTSKQQQFNGIPPSFQRFLVHLEKMQELGLLGSRQSDSQIVYADDQFVNQQLLKMHFQAIGIPESRLVTFQNGQQTLEYFKETLREQAQEANGPG